MPVLTPTCGSSATPTSPAMKRANGSTCTAGVSESAATIPAVSTMARRASGGKASRCCRRTRRTSSGQFITCNWSSADASGGGGPLLLVVSQTFGFTAADDAFAFERSALIGDHRALPFPPPTVVIEHDPIAGHTHLVRPRSVREQRCIVAFAPLAVQHRQPRLAGWIKA